MNIFSPKVPEFDEASFVNDILDGSFRSNASSHSTHSRNLGSRSPQLPGAEADSEHLSNGLDLVLPSGRENLPLEGAINDATSSSSCQNRLDLVPQPNRGSITPQNGGASDIAAAATYRENAAISSQPLNTNPDIAGSEVPTLGGLGAIDSIPGGLIVVEVPSESSTSDVSAGRQSVIHSTSSGKSSVEGDLKSAVPSGADESVLTCPGYGAQVGVFLPIK